MADRPALVEYSTFQLMCDRRDNWKKRAEVAEKKLKEHGIDATKKQQNNIFRTAARHENMRNYYFKKYTERGEELDALKKLLAKLGRENTALKFQVITYKTYLQPEE